MFPFLTYPLALFALASLPALTAIYLLRNRFRRRQVSSLVLWRFRIQSKEGGARVHRLVRRYVGNPEDAADVTQEVFIDLYKGIGGFRGESSIMTWVYRIAVNHCLRHGGALQKLTQRYYRVERQLLHLARVQCPGVLIR